MPVSFRAPFDLNSMLKTSGSNLMSIFVFKRNNQFERLIKSLPQPCQDSWISSASKMLYIFGVGQLGLYGNFKNTHSIYPSYTPENDTVPTTDRKLVTLLPIAKTHSFSKSVLNRSNDGVTEAKSFL